MTGKLRPKFATYVAFFISGDYMKKPTTKAGKAKKVAKVMREFKAGTLHSGKGGKVVKNPKQAIAISLSEAGMSKKKGK